MQGKKELCLFSVTTESTPRAYYLHIISQRKPLLSGGWDMLVVG